MKASASGSHWGIGIEGRYLEQWDGALRQRHKHGGCKCPVEGLIVAGCMLSEASVRRRSCG